MKVIIKRPCDQFGEEATIPNTLKALQEAVGGYIETVTLDNGLVLICNEEGNLLGLPHNLKVGIPPFHHTIVGDIVVVGVDGEEFCDCPIDFKTWKWLLAEWGN